MVTASTWILFVVFMADGVNVRPETQRIEAIPTKAICETMGKASATPYTIEVNDTAAPNGVRKTTVGVGYRCIEKPTK